MSTDERTLGERVDECAGTLEQPNDLHAAISYIAALLREQQAEIAKLNRYLADAELREAALEDEAASRALTLREQQARIAELERDLEAARESVKDAFYEGFTSVDHYNGTVLNSVEDAWAKSDAARARGEG